MNLGTENRKKTTAALVLAGLAVVFVGYRIISPLGGSQAAVNTPLPAVSPPPRTVAPSGPASRRSTSGKKTAAQPSLDPTLKLGLLQSTEDSQYSGNGRNIFRAEVEIPKPIAAPIKQQQNIANTPPAPPPPPPINLKFFGFASKPGEPKRIFLSQGEDVFIAGEGDIVDRRYKVVQIGPSYVTIQDVLTNNTQQIPLTQG